MARIAFIMDRIFRKFGLSGKSFIPILVGTGCGVPGIMASRTIENEKDRTKEIDAEKEYMKTDEYKELLVSYITKAARFADGNPLTIYINSSDQDKKEFLEKRTGMTVTVSEEDFLGGIRSVIPGRNILIDHSFSGALEKEYEEFTFKGGVTGE